MSRSIRNLRRGAVVNLLGYAAQGLRPLMLVGVTAAYGDARWGVFSAIEASLWLTLRLVLGGLDRGLIYWIPRSLHEHGEVRGLWSAILRVFLLSLVGAVVLVLAMPLLAEVWEREESTSVLRLFALSIIPLAQLELLSAASVSRQRLEWATLSREVVAPYAFLGGALVLHALDVGLGLAVAYLVGQTLAAATAAYGLQRSLKGVDVAREPNPLRMPDDLRRYARPLIIADLGSTALGRLDQLLLSFFLPVAQLGVYDVAKRLARFLATVRGSYEHMVIAMVATLSGGSTKRVEAMRASLRDTFSYATMLVLATQAPVVAAFIAFGEPLLGLSGTSFAEGASALYIFAVGWFCLGLFGLAGQVVNGVGRSDLSAWASAGTLVVQALLISAIVPAFGLEGAAVAVVLSVVALAGVQMLQARYLVGPLFRYGPLTLFGCGLVGFTLQFLILHAAEGTAVSSYAGVLSMLACAVVVGPPAFLYIRRTPGTRPGAELDAA